MRIPSFRASLAAATLATAGVLFAPCSALAAPAQDPDQPPGDAPVLTDAIYAGGVDLAFVGRALVVATASGLDVVRDPAADELVFETLLEVALASPPLVAARDGAVGALAADGRLVVWDAESGAERWSAPAAVGLAEPQVTDGRPLLALGPDETAYVGNGKTRLIRVRAGGRLPSVVDLPDAGYVEDLIAGADGALTTLPALWQREGQGWRAGERLDFTRMGGRNRMAVSPSGERLVAYWQRSPALLEVEREGAEPALFDMGYDDVLDAAVAPDGSRVLVSTTSPRVSMGYGPGDVSDEPLGGHLRVFDLGARRNLAELPREGAPLGMPDAEGADRGVERTLVAGLRVVALAGERYATIDLVDDGGEPNLYLRLRGADLVATSERALDGQAWPVHLEAGGGLLCVVFEEREVWVFDVAEEAAEEEAHAAEQGGARESAGSDAGDDVGDELAAAEPQPAAAQDGPPGGMPGDGGPPPTKGIEGAPILVVPITQLDMGFGDPLPPRDVFAVSTDGGILAMGGAGSPFYFVNPRFGFPHQVLSINPPKEMPRPLAARFTDAGELIVLAKGDTPESPLLEFRLDAAFETWAPGVPVDAPREVTGDERVAVELHLGVPGNLDLHVGAIAAESLAGTLVLRQAVGLVVLDALAVSDAGDIAYASGGNVFVLPAP